VNGLHDFEKGPYSEKEKMGFRAADRLYRSPYELDDEFYAELKRSFKDPEIIELTAAAAAFVFFPRFVDALRIPTTPLPAAVARKA
jgi:alkylhydroperoxidase family enzyme